MPEAGINADKFFVRRIDKYTYGNAFAIIIQIVGGHLSHFYAAVIHRRTGFQCAEMAGRQGDAPKLSAEQVNDRTPDPVRDDAVARVEIMLHKREGSDRWRAFARPAKRSRPGRSGSGRPTSSDRTWSRSGTKPPTRNVSRW